MPVNYIPATADQLHAVAGVHLGSTLAGIRKPGRLDLTVISLAENSTVAGVFTRNRYCAAPVLICREHLCQGSIRALVINTGVANAGTGEAGLAAARTTCAQLATHLGLLAHQVLPFSTGVIMENLPVERLLTALPSALDNRLLQGWHTAAQAIMTTDTVPKAASAQVNIAGQTITITGIAKGAGMIKPNMATMLGFIATDAAIAQPLLERLVAEIADISFNCISVDGDTSTNDSFVLISSGASGVPIDAENDSEFSTFKAALTTVAIELAQAIVRDGEGASKFITLKVGGGNTVEECKAVAYAIAHSPLVKTAFFASDPNLGRILGAIGNAATTHPPLANLDATRIKLWLGEGKSEVLVAECGGRAASYREETGAAAMRPAEITVRVDLGRGDKATHLWTCDLSYDYVKINADYRS